MINPINSNTDNITAPTTLNTTTTTTVNNTTITLNTTTTTTTVNKELNRWYRSPAWQTLAHPPSSPGTNSPQISRWPRNREKNMRTREKFFFVWCLWISPPGLAWSIEKLWDEKKHYHQSNSGGTVVNQQIAFHFKYLAAFCIIV